MKNDKWKMIRSLPLAVLTRPLPPLR